MNQLLDDIPYGVIVCHEDGSMLYANVAASKLLNCNSSSIADCNILSFIDEPFTLKVRELLETTRAKKIKQPTNFTFAKLKVNSDNIYKIVAKQSDEDESNIVALLYDYTPTAVQQSILTESYDVMNDNLIKNALILKIISNICNNVLYKDRSNLSDIIVKLSYAFHLKKAAICFRNGTGHVVFARKKEDSTYETGKVDGDHVKKDCVIWQNEVNYLDCKQLIFKVPCSMTCCELEHQHKSVVNVLKLKLSSQKVIGFFEFVEDEKFKLSNAELEILESLSQLLAYIVNNKEQTIETTNYIKEKFRGLTTRV